MRTREQSKAIKHMDALAENVGLVPYSELISLLGNLKWLNDSDTASYTCVRATFKNLDEVVKKLDGPD